MTRACRRLLGALVWVALLSGCASTYHKPQLGDLYNRAAQYHGPDQNPIIVVAGVLGSRLVDGESGTVVWGSFTRDFAKPGNPDGARLVALPMREAASLAELTDGVVPDGVLERIRVKLLGLPIELKAYFHLLGVLGAGGYRDEELALSGVVDYGDNHFTCFQFAYDWRRDNVETARRLHEFIQEKKAYVRAEVERRFGVDKPDLKFDVVAHSMGALPLRYFLRYGTAELPADGSLPELTWAGAEHVERVVLIAPPNAGSVETLYTLVEGKKFGPFLPRYPAALVGTFPSLYQLLPRARHAMVLDAASGEPVDVLDPGLWQARGWGLAAPGQEELLAWLLPEVSDAAERRRIAVDHLRKSLERARQFAAALDRPASTPDGLRLYLVAGDAVDTERSVVVDRATGTLRSSGIGAGDGRVLRASALMDERLTGAWSPSLRGPVDWDEVLFLFTDHLDITKDPAFSDNVLYWLLEDPR